MNQSEVPTFSHQRNAGSDYRDSTPKIQDDAGCSGFDGKSASRRRCETADSCRPGRAVSVSQIDGRSNDIAGRRAGVARRSAIHGAGHGKDAQEPLPRSFARGVCRDGGGAGRQDPNPRAPRSDRRNGKVRRGCRRRPYEHLSDARLEDWFSHTAGIVHVLRRRLIHSRRTWITS